LRPKPGDSEDEIMASSTVARTVGNGAPSVKRREFLPGVRPYAADYYVPDYEPSDTDLLCAFRIRPAPGVEMVEAAAAVAAESSTGTWTEVWSNRLTDLDYYKAKAYRIEDDIAYLAYPIDLFEENSVVNIMSSIVGNVFGFKALSALRLEDMRIPVALVKTFPGPNIGIYDERARLNKWGRPLLGGTVKPKLGLSAKDYATIIYECLVGGLDTTKDDENMNSQPFNRWRDRFHYGIDAVKRAESETGEAKGHFFNVTANSTEEALRRLEHIAAQGSRYVMYDFLTAGFAASADVFKRAGELGIIVHCHRAMHAVFTRQRDHGINMRVIAKWLRLVGGDHLHTGTVVGKLEGSRPETLGIVDVLRERHVSADPSRGLYFDQEFVGLKATWPVASGGIHVLNIPDLYAIYGNDAFWLFGGGTHGHPDGSRAGARANRVATEAIAAGKTLDDAARTCPELRTAMELWSKIHFAVED
jgi:ribulose-bisphosphate carboxylase large chain